MITFWERAARSVDRIFFFCITCMSICKFGFSRFGFGGRLWLLLAPLPGHCLLFTFLVTFRIYKSDNITAIENT